MLNTSELITKQDPTTVEQTVEVTRDELAGIGVQENAEQASLDAVFEGIKVCDKDPEKCCLQVDTEASNHGGKESLVFKISCTAAGCATGGIKRASREIELAVEEGKEYLTHKSPEKT